MTSIAEIKRQCWEIIRLGERATPRPWARVATFYISSPGRCGVAEVKGPSSSLQSTLNGDFIAASRSFTPLAAAALLELIDFVEAEQALSCIADGRAQRRLDALCILWETHP